MANEVKIRRQNRSTMLMQVKSGGVIVYIPRHLRPNSHEVRAFVQEGLAKLADHIPPAREQQTTPQQLRALVRMWAGRMQLAPTKVTLREMRRKWGSCSSRGSVTLNTALCTLPRPLAEYVVVHELAHLAVFDHSPKFWALVAQHMPDYESRKRELDTFPV